MSRRCRWYPRASIALGLACVFEIGPAGFPQKRPQIVEVLRSPPIVARQQLERDQVTEPRHGDVQPRQDLDHLRPARDLRLDAGGREEKVGDDAARRTAAGDEAGGREPMTAGVELARDTS